MVDMTSTVELMLSDNYKDRFKAEFYQLKIRYTKLRIMLDKWDNGELQFEPTCPKQLLESQLKVMGEYLDILGDRAEIEGIELE